MLPDIFSAFDPMMYKSFIPYTSLMLTINITSILILWTYSWPFHARMSSLSIPMSEIMYTQLNRTQSTTLKGLSSTISPLLLSLILINLIGMTPYVFSTSSHLIFTLLLGLPLWLSLLMSSFLYAPKASIAHLLPDGAPTWLNPFLVLIESTSILVRPLTLSFRLAANMSAGHIVLNLINIYSIPTLTSISTKTLMFMALSASYIAFEFAICIIQAYIFCLLLSLYSDDHASP